MALGGGCTFAYFCHVMSDLSDPTVTLPSGERVAQLGQGTWGMGESLWKRKEEVAALRLGIDLGLTLIDTAAT